MMMIHILNYFFFSIMNTNGAALLGFPQSRYCFLRFCDNETLMKLLWQNIPLDLGGLQLEEHGKNLFIIIIILMCEFNPKTRWRKRSSSGPGCKGSESSPVALMCEGVGRKYVYGRVCLCVSAQIYTDRNAQIDLWEWYTTTHKWKRMQDGWRPVLLTLSFPVCTSLTSGGGRGLTFPLCGQTHRHDRQIIPGEKIASQKIQLPAKKMSR